MRRAVDLRSVHSRGEQSVGSHFTEAVPGLRAGVSEELRKARKRIAELEAENDKLQRQHLQQEMVLSTLHPGEQEQIPEIAFS